MSTENKENTAIDRGKFSEEPSEWATMSLSEFKERIDKLTGKKKSQVYFSLLDEIAATDEGREKQRYLRYSIKPKQMKAAEETREAFSRLVIRESCITEKLQEKRRIEEQINSLLTRTVEAAEQIYLINKAISKDPAVSERKNFLSSLILFPSSEEAIYKRCFNEESSCFYMEPVNLWKELVKAGQAYTACLLEAKPFYLAYIEYCIKYDLIEYLPCSSRKILNEIRENKFAKWNLSEQDIKNWLRALAEVNTAEAWQAWLKQPQQFSYPLLYDFYALNPKNVEAYIGDNNFFEKY